MIHLVTSKVTPGQLSEMLEALDVYVKLAVDVENARVAGGGALHADREAALLESGSSQENVWGADWFPNSREVTFESLINIRPSQSNFSLELKNEELRRRIETVVRRFFDND